MGGACDKPAARDLKRICLRRRASLPRAGTTDGLRQDLCRMSHQRYHRAGQSQAVVSQGVASVRVQQLIALFLGILVESNAFLGSSFMWSFLPLP